MSGVATAIPSVNLLTLMGQLHSWSVPDILPNLEPEDLNPRGTQMNMEAEESGMCQGHGKPSGRTGYGLGGETRFLRRGGLEMNLASVPRVRT